jgi:hypothetical protein
MSLTTEDHNDFKDAKMARLVLADYPKVDHPPTWGEREAERIGEENRRQLEAEALAAAERQRAEDARAQAEFAAKPEEERYIIGARAEIDGFLALGETLRRDQPRWEGLIRCLNALANTASTWPDRSWREAGACLLEATYGDPRVGWTDPGLNKQKREKQEKKRRALIADVRIGSTGNAQESGTAP